VTTLCLRILLNVLAMSCRSGNVSKYCRRFIRVADWPRRRWATTWSCEPRRASPWPRVVTSDPSRLTRSYCACRRS